MWIWPLRTILTGSIKIHVYSIYSSVKNHLKQKSPRSSRSSQISKFWLQLLIMTNLEVLIALRRYLWRVRASLTPCQWWCMVVPVSDKVTHSMTILMEIQISNHFRKKRLKCSSCSGIESLRKSRSFSPRVFSKWLRKCQSSPDWKVWSSRSVLLL